MFIDYKVAAGAIDRAMKGIHSLVDTVGNSIRPPPLSYAFAQAYAGMQPQLAPDPALYQKGQPPQTLDGRLLGYHTPLLDLNIIKKGGI